jgi:hypothetical protein
MHEMMVRTINVGLAAKTLKDILECVEVSLQRERVALAIWNKLVPSLAAVHMEVSDSRPTSVHDLNTMLVLNGLDTLPDSPQLIDSVEKVVSVQEKSEGRVPPEADT